LTGSTREQCFFFLFGQGQNGKSTFIETISSVLGDYAAKTPAETLLLTSAVHHLLVRTKQRTKAAKGEKFTR